MNLFYKSNFPCGIQVFSLDILSSSLDWVLMFISIPDLVLLFITVLE